MKRHRERLVALVMAGGLVLLGGCAGTPPEDAEGDDPASVEHVEGTSLSRVTLTEDAARRLGIETVTVREQESPDGGGVQEVVPYSAVVYDQVGRTWTYTNPEPLVFVRASIRVDRIESELALLSAGPAPGTLVVAVGAAELYGTEYGVEEE